MSAIGEGELALRHWPPVDGNNETWQLHVAPGPNVLVIRDEHGRWTVNVLTEDMSAEQHNLAGEPLIRIEVNEREERR